MSFIKFIPCLAIEEHGEEEYAQQHHEEASGEEKRTEAKSTLEVDAERHKDTVGDERTMYPAKTEGKGSDEPRDGSKERAVVEPFRHREAVIVKQHGAMQQAYERTDRRNDTYHEP